jgi:hypothetical protein
VARGLDQALGKLPPQVDTAQTIVEEEDRCPDDVWAQPAIMQSATGYLHELRLVARRR